MKFIIYFFILFLLGCPQVGSSLADVRVLSPAIKFSDSDAVMTFIEQGEFRHAAVMMVMIRCQLLPNPEKIDLTALFREIPADATFARMTSGFYSSDLDINAASFAEINGSRVELVNGLVYSVTSAREVKYFTLLIQDEIAPRIAPIVGRFARFADYQLQRASGDLSASDRLALLYGSAFNTDAVRLYVYADLSDPVLRFRVYLEELLTVPAATAVDFFAVNADGSFAGQLRQSEPLTITGRTTIAARARGQSAGPPRHVYFELIPRREGDQPHWLPQLQPSHLTNSANTDQAGSGDFATPYRFNVGSASLRALRLNELFSSAGGSTDWLLFEKIGAGNLENLGAGDVLIASLVGSKVAVTSPAMTIDGKIVTWRTVYLQFYDDSVAPELTISVVDNSPQQHRGSRSLIFTFSESVNDFSFIDDVTVTGGRLSYWSPPTVQPSGALSYRATFSPDAATVMANITVAARSYYDDAGNWNISPADLVLVVADIVAPHRPLSIRVDHQGAKVNVAAGSGGVITGLTTVTAALAESGGLLEYSTDGGSIWQQQAIDSASNTVNFELPLAGSPYLPGAVMIRQLDAAANTGLALANSRTIILDVTAPAAPLSINVTDRTAATVDISRASADLQLSNSAVTVTFAEAGGELRYSTNGGVSWRTALIRGSSAQFHLTNNVYESGKILVIQIDSMGNAGLPRSNSVQVTVDSDALPAATDITVATAAAATSIRNYNGAAVLSNSNRITVHFAAAGGLLQYTTTVAAEDNWQVAGRISRNSAGLNLASFVLADATYGIGQIKVRQVDDSGNVGILLRNGRGVIIDTVGPPAPSVVLIDSTAIISTGVGTISSSNSALAAKFAEPGGHLQYSVDSGATWLDGNPVVRIGNDLIASFFIANGSYPAGSILVRQIDDATNTGEVIASVRELIVDAELPLAPLDIKVQSGGSAVSVADFDDRSVLAINSPTVTVLLAETGGQVQYIIDGNWNDPSALSTTPVTADKTATFTLADGSYPAGKIQVRQVDDAGNVGDILGVSRTNLIVDTAVPAIVNDIRVGSAANTRSLVAGDAVVVAERRVVVFPAEQTGVIEYTSDGGDSWQTVNIERYADSLSRAVFYLAANEVYPAGTIQVRQIDIAGNYSALVASQCQLKVDTVVPTLSIGRPSGDIFIDDQLSVTFTFNEPVRNFSTAVIDIAVAGSAIELDSSSLSQNSDRSYTLAYSPQLAGILTISVAAATFNDLAGNLNSVPAQIAILVNSPRPQLTISSGDYIDEVIFTFDQNVVDFTAADVTLSAGTLVGIAASASDTKVFIGTLSADRPAVGVNTVVQVADDSYRGAAGGQTGAGATLIIGRNPVQLALAKDSVLYIKDGRLYSWGANPAGQLGIGNTTDKSTPQLVGSAANWVTVAIGADYSEFTHSLAINSQGELYSWGANSDGQLGLGNTVNKSTPQRVGDATDWVAVYAGFSTSYALNSRGELYGWGYNGFNLVSLIDDARRITNPARITVGAAELWQDANWIDGMALEVYLTDIAGNCYFWGPTSSWGVRATRPMSCNNERQNYLVFTKASSVPGYYHLAATGKVFFAGMYRNAASSGLSENYDYQGTANWHISSGFQQTAGFAPFFGFAADLSFIGLAGIYDDMLRTYDGGDNLGLLGLSAAGELYYWGLDLGAGPSTAAPVSNAAYAELFSFGARLGDKNDWVSIHSAGNVFYAIDSAGDLYSWGVNISSGALGLGDRTSVYQPTLVAIGG